MGLQQPAPVGSLQYFHVAWLVISHRSGFLLLQKTVMTWGLSFQQRASLSRSPPTHTRNPHSPHHDVQPATLVLWFCENDFWIAAGINQPWLLLQLTSVRVIFSAGLSYSIPGYVSQRRKKTLGQRLLGMLPSENSSKRTEDQDSPQEVLKMLVDLVSARPSLGFG